MNPSQEIRQALDRQQLTLRDAVRLRRGSHPLLPFRDVVHDARLRGERDPVADAEVSSDAGLARNRHVRPDLRGTGDAHLCHDDRMIADVHVVGDLHEVVDLRALADDRRSERGPVDGRVGPDLDVVLDLDLTDLSWARAQGTVRNLRDRRFDLYQITWKDRT